MKSTGGTGTRHDDDDSSDSSSSTSSGDEEADDDDHLGSDFRDEVCHPTGSWFSYVLT